MKNEPITVVILPGGTTCKELNPLGEEPMKYTWLATKFVTTFEWDKWKAAEDNLRTLEIEFPEFVMDYNGNVFETVIVRTFTRTEIYKVNEKYKATISNGKAVIL